MTLEYVGGQLRPPEMTLSGYLHDPNTGEPTRAQQASGTQSLEQALDAADTMHRSGEWRHASWWERRDALTAFTEALVARSEQLAQIDAEQTGVPLRVTRELVGAAVTLPTAIAHTAEEVLEERLPGAGYAQQHWLPLGPAAVITPWNAPTAVALGKLCFALAAGAPVILKPSEWAPGSASVIAEAAHAAGLPGGTLQVLHGTAEVGSRLVRDKRIAAISLTGSFQAGLSVARAAAERLVPVDLELSGNNPVLVLAGAELSAVAAALVRGMTFLNGQWCSAPRRVVAPREAVDELRELVLAGLEHIVIGPSTCVSSDLGPLINAAQRDRLHGQLRELQGCGAKSFDTGVCPVGGGYFVPPTIVTGGPGVGGEELFGPVIQMLGYTELDEAVHVANDHPYGLAAYVFGPDAAVASRVGVRLRAGAVRINTVEPGLPAADATCGMWAGSGHGSVGRRASLRFFTGARCVG